MYNWQFWASTISRSLLKNFMHRRDYYEQQVRVERYPPKKLYNILLINTHTLFCLQMGLFSSPRVGTKLIKT